MFEIGDVSLVVGRDVRDDDPVAVKIGRGNLLDAAELLALDRPVLRKIDLGPGQKVDAADAASACGRCLRLGRRRSALAEGLDVFTQNAAVIARALDLAEIDAQFARQLAHGRTGIGEREASFVKGADHRRSCGGGRRGRRRRHGRDVGLQRCCPSCER